MVTPFNPAAHEHLVALGYKYVLHETPQAAIDQAARMVTKLPGTAYEHRWDGPLPEFDEYWCDGDHVEIWEDGKAS